MLTLFPAPMPKDHLLHEAQAPQLEHGGYVGSGACRSCHPGAWASWRATYHRTMTQQATPEAVLAPFDGRQLERGGERFTVHDDGGQYRVCRVDDTEGDGSLSIAQPCWRVVQTTGSHHIQANEVDPRKLLQFTLLVTHPIGL
ncbi:MAG: hypothetical protein AAFX99_21720, partial [Myxococcota bacterium]